MVGSVVASTALGVALGALGQPFVRIIDGRQQLLILVLLILAGAAADLRLLGLRLPTHRRQVNESWMTEYRGWAYGFGYGVQLGLAVVTVVNTSAICLTIAAAFLAGSMTGAAVLLGSFGLFWALILLRTRSVTRPRDLGNLYDAIERSQPVSRRITVGAQVLIAGGLIAAIAIVT